MYQIGDTIVYGTTGVCRIEKISELAFAAKGMLYYTLKPLSDPRATVYVQVDRSDMIRQVISRSDANRMIDRMPHVLAVSPANDRQFETECKEIIRTADSERWIALLKGMHEKQREKASNGKTLSATDTRIFQFAEKLLYGELAVALDIAPDQVAAYISHRLADRQAC